MRKGLLLLAAILFVTESSFAQESSGVPPTPTAASPMTKLADATPILLQIVARGLSWKGHLAQVPATEGTDELASLRELNSNDVAKVSDAALADLQAVPEKK